MKIFTRGAAILAATSYALFSATAWAAPEGDEPASPVQTAEAQPAPDDQGDSKKGGGVPDEAGGAAGAGEAEFLGMNSTGWAIAGGAVAAVGIIAIVASNRGGSSASTH